MHAIWATMTAVILGTAGGESSNAERVDLALEQLRDLAFSTPEGAPAERRETVQGLVDDLDPESLDSVDLVRLLADDLVVQETELFELSRSRLQTIAGTDQLAAPAAASLLLLDDLRAARDRMIVEAASATTEELLAMTPDQLGRTQGILAKEAFDTAVRQGLMSPFFRSLGSFNMGGAQTRLLPEVVGLQRFLTEDVTPSTLMEMFGLMHLVIRASRAGSVDQRTCDAMRARFLSSLAATRRLHALRPLEEQWFEQARAMLTSDWAHGVDLAGQAAPELTFAWSSSPSLAGSLSQLRGKIVLLDFWATWCSGCVLAFDELRALQERYVGQPVVILGVTGYQGQAPEGGNWVSTDGDPRREEQLLAEFLTEHDVTWPVVISEAPLFDARYQVRVLPHLALVGPDGTLVRNDLAGASRTELHEQIDALLEAMEAPEPRR